MADKGREHERRAHDIELPEMHRPEVLHETSDINVWSVGRFAIGLGLLCVFSLFLLYGLFRYFQSATGGPMPSTELNVDARTLPPAPRLQHSPILDLREMREAEDKILNGYGWIDRAHGIVHVPISRAIQMLAQRGLPSRPENGLQSASTAVVPHESGLGPIMIQPGGPLAPELSQPAAAGAAGEIH